MANFTDIHENLTPQLKAIITASTTLKNSSRFKKLLEVNLIPKPPRFPSHPLLFQIVLAFGNYMNSSKRGPAYGFKLASLEIVSPKNVFSPIPSSSTMFFLSQLSDTRTHDKRLTLLHFIVQTVQERFPDISNFDHELKSTERAAQGKRIACLNDSKKFSSSLFGKYSNRCARSHTWFR